VLRQNDRLQLVQAIVLGGQCSAPRGKKVLEEVKFVASLEAKLVRNLKQRCWRHNSKSAGKEMKGSSTCN
jgi:hypothetical protein